MQRPLAIWSIEGVGSNRIRGHGQEIDAKLNAGATGLLIPQSSTQTFRLLMDPRLDVVDGAFREEATDGGTAFPMELMIHGAENFSATT